MIIEYQRPMTITEALKLLAREEPITYPLGGGTLLNQPNDKRYAVVDLQSLGLNQATKKGNSLQIGATFTLQHLLDIAYLPQDLYQSIRYEATHNLRQMATVAGTLAVASGRSPFTTVMLALDARMEIHAFASVPELVGLGEWLALRSEDRHNNLISVISIPLNIRLAFEYIARTPADQPIVCAAVVQWASGRTRLVLGGWGRAPLLAMDGPEAGDIVIAARNAYSHAGDGWASPEYRQEMAGVLALRCLNLLSEK
jgi:CO/xanthine dehydrogenase FAD-binding subunit